MAKAQASPSKSKSAKKVPAKAKGGKGPGPAKPAKTASRPKAAAKPAAKKEAAAKPKAPASKPPAQKPAVPPAAKAAPAPAKAMPAPPAAKAAPAPAKAMPAPPAAKAALAPVPAKPALKKESVHANAAAPATAADVPAMQAAAPPAHHPPVSRPSVTLQPSAMPSIAIKPATVIRPAVTAMRPAAGAHSTMTRPQPPLRPGIKAPAKVQRYKDLLFRPRFAYGEMCSLAEICGAGFGTEMGFGIARFTKARIPWAIKYDEVLMVLSGVLRVRTGGRVLEAGPHDSIWLPAGTELIYEADDALVAYAVHPIGSAPSGGGGRG